ncbi:MAG: serine/threonine-protein kinase [Woeseiaceae bacterium]|nr:serine/threonine-protein kinase [Woeseiaceae bacterium]
MNLKCMIIDGSAEFRRLLMHHVTTHWPDAEITEFDPLTSGFLPDEFSGAGNDIILLGNELGDRDGLEIVKQWLKQRNFPPLVYFGDEDEDRPARHAGVGAFFPRQLIRHDALIVRISDLLKASTRRDSTGRLFVGDQRAGLTPLIRGYRFIRKLGVTEHSAVYLAERESQGINVVLKVLRQIPETSAGIGAFDRFLQEYELIAEMDHPNIVSIYDLGVSDDHAHIAMEYLDGGDLKQRIDEGIVERDAVEYFRQITSAIAEIHKVGILHRDLKPGNVMLRNDGSIALIDFGLAKRMRLEMAISDSGEIFGTPYYMSPEQGHGNGVDERSDIYSLGVILYEMLTGRKPYTADSAMGIIYKHAKAPVPLLPMRYARHQALMNMLLAKDPDNRLQTAGEVLEWL